MVQRIRSGSRARDSVVTWTAEAQLDIGQRFPCWRMRSPCEKLGISEEDLFPEPQLSGGLWRREGC